LGEATKPARGDYFFSKGLGLKRIRDVAKEFDNLGNRIKGRRGLVIFPVVDRSCTGTKPFGNLFLEKL